MSEHTKIAVYFVAVGEAALHCLKLAYNSFRAAGATEDVYILSTETDLPFAIDDRTTLCTLRSTDINLNPAHTGPMSTFDIRGFAGKQFKKQELAPKWIIANTRTLIDTYIPTGDYSHILYMDADILFQAPLSPLYAFLKKHPTHIITARNRSRRLGTIHNFTLFPPGRSETATGTNLTTVELLRHWWTQPVCSDVVYFPTTSAGLDFLHAWRDECQRYHYQDQSALQAVVLREQFKANHVLAPYDIFGYGTDNVTFAKTGTVSESSSTLVHFNGALKDTRAIDTYYETYIENQEL